MKEFTRVVGIENLRTMYNYLSHFRTMKCVLIVTVLFWEMLTHVSIYHDEPTRKETNLMTKVRRKKNKLATLFILSSKRLAPRHELD